MGKLFILNSNIPTFLPSREGINIGAPSSLSPVLCALSVILHPRDPLQRGNKTHPNISYLYT